MATEENNLPIVLVSENLATNSLRLVLKSAWSLLIFTIFSLLSMAFQIAWLCYINDGYLASGPFTSVNVVACFLMAVMAICSLVSSLPKFLRTLVHDRSVTLDRGFRILYYIAWGAVGIFFAVGVTNIATIFTNPLLLNPSYSCEEYWSSRQPLGSSDETKSEEIANMCINQDIARKLNAPLLILMALNCLASVYALAIHVLTLRSLRFLLVCSTKFPVRLSLDPPNGATAEPKDEPKEVRVLDVEGGNAEN